MKCTTRNGEIFEVHEIMIADKTAYQITAFGWYKGEPVESQKFTLYHPRMSMHNDEIRLSGFVATGENKFQRWLRAFKEVYPR